jgi:hypothetical protein
MTGILRVPEQYPVHTLAAIATVFALAYGAAILYLDKPDGRIVVGDAVHHFVQLRSAVFDRDLHFRNEYMRLYGLEGPVPGTEWIFDGTATGHVRNYMPVGPALLWAPAFLLVGAGVWISNLLGGSYPLDGYARAFQAAAGFSGIGAAAIGSWLAYRTASRLFERGAAIWAILAVWLASSTIYYSVISPTYSHAASMLAVSAVWLVWTRTLERQSLGRYGAIGLLVGVAALMRWQDAVLLIVPALDLARSWRNGLTWCGARLLATGAGAAAGFAPQMAVWTALYGQPLAIPQGPAFMRWGDPALFAVLFSDNHGLLTWTPVIGLALAGLVLLVRRDRLIGAAAIAFFVSSWYVNAAVADWWGGEAFGARRFVSCFPVFVLGTAAVFDRLRPRLSPAVPAVLFIGYTLLLLVQYQAFMHGLRDVVPYPRGVYDLWLARFRVPFDVAAWWLSR